MLFKDESIHESMPRFFFKPINIHGEPVMGPDGARLSDQGKNFFLIYKIHMVGVVFSMSNVNPQTKRIC